MQFADAIIFDLDGMLLDSERLALEGLVDASVKLGLQIDLSVFRALIGLNSKSSALKLMELLGPDFPVETLFAEYRRSMAQRHAELKPGAREMLTWVRQVGLPCALATSTRREKVEKILTRFKLQEFFQYSVCGDEVQHGKPAPEIYLRAAQGLGVDPIACLALEDSGPGVSAALAAGMRVLHIPDLADIGGELRGQVLAEHPSLSDAQSEVARLLRSDLQDFLGMYSPRDAADEARHRQILDFAARNPRCCERSEIEGHITASAWLVDWTAERVLLTHHRKLNRWLQLGGHADGERRVLNVALREAREESGIEEIIPLRRTLFDVDVHEIPARGNEPAHLHYDLRFALQVPRACAFAVSDESHHLAWVEIKRLQEYTEELSMLRMRDKWLSR